MIAPEALEVAQSYEIDRAAIENQNPTPNLLRYRASREAARVLHDFMHNHVGDPRKHFGTAADPAIKQGGFTELYAHGITYAGTLFLVRKRPLSEASPIDFYIRMASLRTPGPAETMTVAKRELEHNPGGFRSLSELHRETFYFGELPEEQPTAVERIHSGNPWLDLLDEYELNTMSVDTYAQLPRLSLSSGTEADASYFYDGVIRSKVASNLGVFMAEVLRFDTIFPQNGQTAIEPATMSR